MNTTDTDPTTLVTAHSPEPWHTEPLVADNGGSMAICNKQQGILAVIPPLNEDDEPDEATAQRDPCDEANARRIVAAVNACAGISTEALEQGAVRQQREALEGLLAWADDSRYKIDSGDSERRIWLYNTLERARAAVARTTAALRPGLTSYLVTAWCERPFYAQCQVEAENAQEALAKARTAIHDAPAEECDDGYFWNEWRVDTADTDGVLVHLDPPARMREAAPQLLEACQMVVDRWARGDLAAAARACHAALVQVNGQLGEPDAGRPAEAEPPRLVRLLWDFIENGTSSYGLTFFDLRAKVREEAARWEGRRLEILDLPAARTMLMEALAAVLPYARAEAENLEGFRGEDEVIDQEADKAWEAVEQADAALANATSVRRPA